MENGVFFGFVCCKVLMLKGLFWCVWYCFKSVKNACFPSFWGFFWGGSLLFVWVWKVLVFLCFLCLFLFVLSCFCFCLVCFVLGFVVGCCCFVFFVSFFFWLFCFFVFFGGFKGHVRWPEGPPHLALNPPYFMCFVFFVFVFFLFFFVSLLFFCLFFLEGLRVRWGGPKGHLTWP